MFARVSKTSFKSEILNRHIFLKDEGLKAPVQYTLIQSMESKHFAINSRTGSVSLVTPLPLADMMHGITLVIKATQLNNVDRYALTTLILFRNESHQTKHINSRLTFLQSKFQAKVPENLNVGSRLLALPTNRPGRHLQYLISDHKAATQFSMGALGEIILQQPLDYEKTSQHAFTVMATDGLSNATTEVNIDVMDVNDWEPRFRQSHYEFVVPENANEPVPLGKLEAADGDKNDAVSLVIRGAHVQYFDIDSEGMLWMKQMPPNVTLVHLIATATDTGIPPRSSSIPITITMESVAMAQSNWASGIMGVFGAVIALFLLVIMAMSIYIYKQKKPNGKNRVHSHDGSVSAANLVNHEKAVNGANFLGNSNIRMANPLNNNNNHGGSGSSISVGASTILAASLEREAQREREREKDNYTATVRSTVFYLGSKLLAFSITHSDFQALSHVHQQLEVVNCLTMTWIEILFPILKLDDPLFGMLLKRIAWKIAEVFSDRKNLVGVMVALMRLL